MKHHKNRKLTTGMAACVLCRYRFRGKKLPPCKPSMVTVGIISFLWSYNDLFTQMFFLRTKENRAITILLNKYIIKGMTVGAVKG